jgi:DNA-binding NarL/FixJ family response regulator
LFALVHSCLDSDLVLVALLVCFLCVQVTSEYQAACLTAGMDLFTSKPVSVEELMQALRAAHQWHTDNPRQEQQRSRSINAGANATLYPPTAAAHTRSNSAV